MPTLESKNVSYAYEKGKAILSNVSAELETGKMYAILGPSGSGKTTLLSLLGGLDTPTQGNVLFGLPAHFRYRCLWRRRTAYCKILPRQASDFLFKCSYWPA